MFCFALPLPTKAEGSMDTRKLVLLGLATATLLWSPASQATVLYTNGSPDTYDVALSINFDILGSGRAVADSFTLANNSTVTGANFTAWLSAGDTGVSVSWAVLNGSPGAGGTVLFSGTATQ